MDYRKWILSGIGVMAVSCILCHGADKAAAGGKEASSAPEVKKVSPPPVPETPGEKMKRPPFSGRKDFRKGPPPYMGFGKGPGPGRRPPRMMPGDRKGSNHFYSRFTPEEHASLQELLRKKDMDGFRKRMQTLRLKYASPEDKKVMELRQAYHAAKTPEEKAKLKEELKTALKVQMEKRLEFTRAQIRSAEAKLARLKKFYERNLAEKENMVNNLTEFMCSHPSGSPFHRYRKPPAKPAGRDKK